jgi:hypothetical protein
MGFGAPGGREDPSTNTNPKAQTPDRTINKVHLPTVFFFFLVFFFRGLGCVFFGPGEKMNCFYTGQFPDVKMVPLFFRWFQAPPGCKVQTTGEKPKKNHLKV